MDRIEIVARAMARHHLGQQTFASALNPELIAKVCRGAEDKLWPSLVEEAKAVVQALDDAAAPKAVESSHEAALEPARQAAVQSEKAAAVETPGGERGDRVSSSGEKKAETNRSDDDSDPLAGLPIAWDEQPQAPATAPSGRRDRTLDGLRSALAALGVSAGTGTGMH
jgi:hypothetical protein